MVNLTGKKELIDNYYKYRALLRCCDDLKSNQELSNFFSKSFENINRIASEPLNLAVMGEFSVGKSSFINKLLGVDFLPVGITPITSVITTLKYGEEEEVKIHYVKDDESDEIVSYKSYSVLKNFQKANEIDNELHRREIESIKEIVVFLKNDNLKKFNIIDTPGFNHSEICDEITKGIFGRLDYVVWLFDATQAGKLTESILLDELFGKVHNIYAVINKIDVVEKEKIESVSADLVDKINNNYPEKFINHQEIHCISIKKSDDDFGFLYKNFLNNFNSSVIDRDYQISTQAIDSIYDEIQLQLETAQNEVDTFQNKTNLLLTEFIKYGETEDFIEKANELSQETFTVIVEVINKILVEISQSKIYNELSTENPALKFYCNYKTFEKIRELKFLIGDIYLKYLDFYDKKFSTLNSEIKSLINSISSFCSESLIKEMNDILYYNESIINGFIAKKYKLATTGYMFGLLSDNFIYQKFLKGQTLSETLKSAKGTIVDSSNSFLSFLGGEKNKKDLKDTPSDSSDNGIDYSNKIHSKINREIIIQIFQIDLETTEVEDKLSELREKITDFTANITKLVEHLSQELKVAKC